MRKKNSLSERALRLRGASIAASASRSNGGACGRRALDRVGDARAVLAANAAQRLGARAQPIGDDAVRRAGLLAASRSASISLRNRTDSGTKPAAASAPFATYAPRAAPVTASAAESLKAVRTRGLPAPSSESNAPLFIASSILRSATTWTAESVKVCAARPSRNSSNASSKREGRFVSTAAA